MKAYLLYKDRDFDLQEPLPSNEQTLVQDLELDTLFSAMVHGDKFLLEVAKKGVLSSLDDPDTILYRQDILRDCLKNDAIIRAIYDLAIETIENEKKNYWGIFSNSPGAILGRSLDVLQMFVEMLKKLRQFAYAYADKFESEGFTTFFVMLMRELDDEYFASVQNHLGQLRFRNGVLTSAELGKGSKGTNYVLRKPHAPTEGWLRQLFKQPSGYTFYIAERDENGARALSELRDNGLNLVANALAQSNDHILSFFRMLRTELAFYVGCLNLYGELRTHLKIKRANV